MKKMNKKGYTLAELLSVVAIIAVLVAVAIPVFTSQLEKSRDAVTVSNLRSAYAMAQTAWLTEQSDTDNKVTFDKDNKKVTVGDVVAKGTASGFSDADKELPFTAPSAMGGTAGKYTVTFQYGTNGLLSSVSAAAGT